MESARRALLALFASLLTTTSVHGGTVSVAVQSDQLSTQPPLTSNVVLTCKVSEQNFFQVANIQLWQKQQYGESTWLNVTTGVTTTTRTRGPGLFSRYTTWSLQANATDINYYLEITGFQQADAGTYRCQIYAGAGSSGKLYDDYALSAGLQTANVQLSTDSPFDVDTGSYIYEVHATTSCTVTVNSTADVTVEVLYNDISHTTDFDVGRTTALQGDTAGLKVVVQTITLTSHTFRPVNRKPSPLVCTAKAKDDDSSLGSQSIRVAAKSNPQLSCTQSGDASAYLSDLNVLITCETQDYEWHTASNLAFSFTSVENGEPAVVAVYDGVERHGRRKVDDAQAGKHSLKINRVTSEIATYPEYNVTLVEDGQVLASTSFTLKVINKARATSDALITCSSFMTILFLSFVAILKSW